MVVMIFSKEGGARMYYMGIDFHKKYFVSPIMDKEGKVLKRKSRGSSPNFPVKRVTNHN